MLHLEKLFYSVPQRMSVCGFCLSYTLPWDLGLFCCIPTFVFLNIVCGGNFHLSRQQMWMRTKFSNRCRIRRWPNRLPFYSSNNSGHWASVGYTWYGFTNIIRHQLFVTEYFLDSGPPMGDFCEKSHFSPLKSWKYLNIAKKSEKKRLAGPGLGGRGCHQGEKISLHFWTN